MKMSDGVSVEPTLEELAAWVQAVLPIADRLSYAGSPDLQIERTIVELRQNLKKATMCLYSAIELTLRLNRETPESNS